MRVIVEPELSDQRSRTFKFQATTSNLISSFYLYNMNIPKGGEANQKFGAFLSDNDASESQENALSSS